MGPEKLLRAGTWKGVCRLSKAFPAKTQSTQRLRRGEGKVCLYSESMWESSQRHFHSTSGIEGTFSTLMELRDWWGEKDKQISDSHVIIVLMRVLG